MSYAVWPEGESVLDWDHDEWDGEWEDDDYDFDLPDDEDGYVDRTVPICEDCGEHDWPWAGCACDDDEKWGVPCCTTLASVGTCSCPDREQNVGY